MKLSKFRTSIVFFVYGVANRREPVSIQRVQLVQAKISRLVNALKVPPSTPLPEINTNTHVQI